MKCYQCGFEKEEDFSFCPNCGFSAPSAPPQAPSASAVILPALRDPMFLILCILMSALCLISLSAGSVPLLNILFAVFLWLTYAQAQKGIADARHLRCVSGVVYAQYVITYVVAGIIVVCGIILVVVFAAMANTTGLTDAFMYGLTSAIGDVDPRVVAILSGITSISGIVIAVLLVFFAVLVIILNVFSSRYIHRFAKSVYQSIEQEKLELKHLGATKVWLIIVTVSSGINMINSLGNITAAAIHLVTLGTTLLATLLLHKYFK